MPGFTSSWVDCPADSDFSIANIPFGIFSTPSNASSRVASAIGNFAVDLSVLCDAGLLTQGADALKQSTLNAFMALGRPVWRSVRRRIQELLAGAEEEGADAALRTNEELKKKALVPLSEVTMHVPANIGDYTDFYSSREHATNVGIMFRGKDNALQPNWLHLPVGYHGRSSSVVVSGTDFKRPCGQLQTVADDPSKGSIYGASKQLDFELEIGTFIGPGNSMGSPIDIEKAEDHIFGLVLLNDWSGE
jgi:fumarylacetoacetase